MNLAGLRVWITRPADAAKTSALRWAATGASPLVEPLVELVDVEPTPESVAAFSTLAEPWTLMLTSPRAAESFVRWSLAFADTPRPTAVCAIGPATADAATRAGFAVTQVAGRATAKNLADEIEGPGPVVYPASSARIGDAAEALAAGGRRVLELTLYGPQGRRLTPSRWSELVGSCDLVALYAPSAAVALADGIGERRRDVVCAALGPTTHAAAIALGLEIAVTASDPGESHLIDAARVWWAAR